MGDGAERGEKLVGGGIRRVGAGRKTQGEGGTAIALHVSAFARARGGDGGITDLYYAPCVAPTLVEEFERRLRSAGEMGEEGRGPGGRVEQRLPN